MDEAHYIKNAEARRTVNVNNLSKHASRTLFMTGTALENKVDEMIALIKMLQPRIAVQVQGMAHICCASIPEKINRWFRCVLRLNCCENMIKVGWDRAQHIRPDA